MKMQSEQFKLWMREALERGLFEAHWNEVGADLEQIPLDLDFRRFLMLESAGMLAAFTARDDEGALAGYAVLQVSPHILHKAHTFAYSMFIYLAPAHRGHGVDLVRLVEREMRGRGVSKLFFTAMERTPFGEVFEAMGYTHTETAFGKLLV